jgi:DNA-binding MarR family transcriptional regulator
LQTINSSRKKSGKTWFSSSWGPPTSISLGAWSKKPGVRRRVGLSSRHCAGGVTQNQNQIATLLGLDRTVVRRTVKSLIREGLVSERKAPSGRALLLQLTAKGNRYRSVLIQQRRAVDAKLRRRLSPRQILHADSATRSPIGPGLLSRQQSLRDTQKQPEVDSSCQQLA